MASVEDLKNVLKDTLERTGQLSKLKAQLRADVLNTLSAAQTEVASTSDQGLSNENLLVNELIREYLIFNGYRETLSVFMPETGQPQVRPFDRSFLSSLLQVPDGPNTSQVPLLYSLVERAKQPKS